MRNRTFHTVLATSAVATLVLAGQSTALAKPLKLAEIAEMGSYIDCAVECDGLLGSKSYDEYASYYDCISKCGISPRTWEKNGISPVDETDQELALLEFQNATSPTPLICYADEEETIVIPGALCAGDVCMQMPTCTPNECAAPLEEDLQCEAEGPGGPVCWWPDSKRPAACPDVVCKVKPVHTFQQCADADGDGIPTWLELWLKMDPNSPDALCNDDAPCMFTQVCEYSVDLGAGFCQARQCQGPCSAFHLALVAQDDREVIVHVFYDYTPVPARALDLYIVYDHAALKLEDSRRLAPLVLQAKQLATTHLADGTLRLSVFDTASSQQIPTGPLVELVFQRHTEEATLVAFTKEDLLQVKSVAPLQGSQAIQDLLADDAVWGPGVLIPELSAVSTIMRLWYGFDSLSEPLSYSNVPDAEEVCALYSPCANEPDEKMKALELARLDALQQGMSFGGETIQGLSGSAVYLHGGSDHLRMPVHYRLPLVATAQSFSMSTWVYSEGNSANEMKKTPQILYQHEAFDERTRFGLALKEEGGDILQLVFFAGDMLSVAPKPIEISVAKAIPTRTWHHAGFTLDANAGKAELYFDGKRVGEYMFVQPPAAVSCPQFFGGTNLVLHKEGDVLGGSPPEFVYLAVEKNNTYKIHRMDPSGLSDIEIAGDAQFSYRDPDYSPIVDRIVYSSNATGAFEIWMADGMGENSVQLTQGFGNTDLGTSARRPRWAPDASAIVFDSEAFDVLAEDNDFSRVKHLYYIGYDAVANEPKMESASGAVFEILDYDALVATDTIGEFRITGAAMDEHHWNARWLTGKDMAQGTLGELLMATASPGLEGNNIKRVTLVEQVGLSGSEPIVGLGDAGQELRLLAAHYSTKGAVPQPIVTEKLFYERSDEIYVVTDQFTKVESSANGEVLLKVSHNPSGYSKDCWDTNHNKLKEPDEDRNGDTFFDEKDCYPYEIRNLYVEYDMTRYLPVLETKDAMPQELGTLLKDAGKKLDLQAVYPEGRAFVRVELLSPLNVSPIGAGEIVVIHFKELNQDAPVPAFGFWSKESKDELLVKNLLTADPPTPFMPANYFEWVQDAVFSPAGLRLMLAAISMSRPILLRTVDLTSAANAEKILLQPMKLSGFDWIRRDQFMACNWAGGYQHPQNKAVMWGLRGGLDDLKVYSGLRAEAAFRSEAERGHAYLEAAGLDGEVESKLASCANDNLQCPPYQMCVDSKCKMVKCSPDDPYACLDSGGRCTLRPVSVEQENTDPKGKNLFEWVCASDCNVDAQCYEQECLNGPCLYCDPTTLTCVECRESVKQLGELQIAGIEGCPDQKSFRCEYGACVTDCYAFKNDQSIYLCDQGLEYCSQGYCVLHDWTWWDLAPASFEGGLPTRRDVPPDPTVGWNGYTMCVDQRIPVEIVAYGVSDYGASPEVIVEAKGGPFYGGDWHRIGEAIVQARTMNQAKAAPLTLSSPYPFDSLRLRMVTSPYDDVSAAATGLMEGDKDFCLADLEATAKKSGEIADPAVCYRRAQGSAFGLGYRAELPLHESNAACQEHGMAGCLPTQMGEFNYLYGGNPAIILLDVRVDGGAVMNNIVQDRVCAYGGYDADGLMPLDDGVPKKMFYGDIATEQSPQKVKWCADNPGSCDAPAGDSLVQFDHGAKGYALLNCNVYDPAHGGETAGVVMAGISLVKPWPASAGAIVLDNGDKCFVEVNKFLNSPCYEWTGGSASLDPHSAIVTLGDKVATGTYDFGLFRSFGHSDGFEVVPLPAFNLFVQVKDYLGGGMKIRCGSDVISVPDVVTLPLQCPKKVKKGKRIDVAVAKQPDKANHKCAVILNPENMPVSDATIAVQCGNMHMVGGTLSGLSGGAVKLLAEMKLNGSSVSSKETLVLIKNGAFEFVNPLPKGDTYDVKVSANPAGQLCYVSSGSGTMGIQDVKSISVTCKLAQLQELKVDVKNLEKGATGLEVLEMKSKGKAHPTESGLAALDVKLYPNTEYELKVTKQPSKPPHICKMPVDGGKGKMLDGATTGATVTCTKLTSYAIKAKVVNLMGKGLTLSLNGLETLVIGDTTALDADSFATFKTQIVEGNEYSVAVEMNPQAPVQVCEVTNGEGIAQGKAPDGIYVICSEPLEQPQYYIGGKVKGLAGYGLKLHNKQGLDYEITPKFDGGGNPKEFDFAFSTKFPNLASYDVTVSENPLEKIQVCTVEGGYGKILSKDVTSIQVTCKAAGMLIVDLKHPASDGGEIKAVMIKHGVTPNDNPKGCNAPTCTDVDKCSPPADANQCTYQPKPTAWRMSAREPNDARVINDKAVFFMVDSAVPSGKADKEAHLEPGDYLLYIVLNKDGGTKSNGKPDFNAGDVAFYDAVTIVSDKIVTRKILEAEFYNTVQPDVPNAGNLPHDAICYWSPDGAAPFPVPASSTSPVLTTYRNICTKGTDGKYTCKQEYGIPLIKHGWDPLFGQVKDVAYAITCFSDYAPKTGGPEAGSADHWNYWAACWLPQTGFGKPCYKPLTGCYYWK